MNQEADACATCGESMAPIHGKPPRCARCGAIPNDEDSQSYVVNGDPEHQPCLNCKKPLPRGALLCNHCGYNQQTGETLQRVHKKVAKEWEAGLRFGVRLGILLGMATTAALATIVVVYPDGKLLSWSLSWLLGTTLWAFVLGTYPRLNLTRSIAGQVRIWKTWRCCFVPLPPTYIRWRSYVGISVTRSGTTDLWDWVILLCLAPWGVVPAFLWWYYAVRPDQLDVALTQEHGVQAMLLYRGRDEAMAKEVAAIVHEVTGLRAV